jgi:2,4-dienoyl-CoA reductase-like NADH-dependent reductase (Old Yellow Enzyme family)/thioredoxin reductase
VVKDWILFRPLQIGAMTVKNRIGLAPLLNMPRAADFGPNEATTRWFEARAKNEVGFIMTGTINPLQPLAPAGPERFGKLAEAMHAHGAKLGVQIGAGGPMGGVGPSLPPYPNERHPKQGFSEYLTGQISPLPLVKSVAEFKVEQIEAHLDIFARAAKALKEAGVDCVELHCAHGGATLYCSFISPFYNRREDEYGGTWENRLRFPTQTIRRMREAVGPDYTLLVRISADELLGGWGITLEDTVQKVVPAMEAAGVDALDVSQGSILHSPEGITIPLYYPRGCYIHHAAAVKKATKLPVIGVGRIVDLEMAERFLEEGKADLIYMGRQLTSDPATVRKYFEGRPEDVNKCIGCLEGCGTPCSVNYDIWPEAVALTPALKPKKVLIVGGGVAGMEAARVSALRGHRVTLLEKGSAVGGAVATLALDPLTAEFENVVRYLGVQLGKLGVDVRVCQEATPRVIESFAPEAVIVAAGASLVVPEEVQGLPGVMDHLKALRQRQAIGRRVVVWGLMYGAELAISLAREGKEVTLLGEGGEDIVASHASALRRWWILRKISDFNPVRAGAEAAVVENPTVLFYTRVKAAIPGSLLVTNRHGLEKLLPFDTLIISRGRKRNDELMRALDGKVPELFAIGDCGAAGNIKQAIFSANEVARKL